MKVTLKTLLESRQAFKILLNLKLVSQATMFRLKTIARQALQHLETYDEQQLFLAQEYGEMDEDGNWKIKPVPETIQAYADAIKELQSVELDISGEQVGLFDLRVRPVKGVSDDDGLEWVTSAILTDLDWLIKE